MACRAHLSNAVVQLSESRGEMLKAGFTDSRSETRETQFCLPPVCLGSGLGTLSAPMFALRNPEVTRSSSLVPGGLRPSNRGWFRLFLFVATLFTVLAGLSKSASAYPFMIRHGYTACAVCHIDPSGGSVVTPYGRAQSDLLLRTRYGEERTKTDEPSKWSNFAFVAPELPDWLLLGGSFRELALYNKVEKFDASSRLVQMVTELRVGLKLSRFRSYLSGGFQHLGARLAQVTTATKDNMVSREHWLGLALDAFGEDDALLIRAGRIPIPFGLRQYEHTLWVRTETKTGMDENQQHGVAFSFQKSNLRGEAMALLGNYQTGPDDYRERGYSAFVEWAPRLDLALGVNSLFTGVKRDPATALTLHRHAHGIFARAVPWKPLVLMTELDVLINARPLESTYVGVTGMLQADWEVIQGVHVLTTGELLRSPGALAGTSYGGWLSAAWFFAPHADLRVDFIERSQVTPAGRFLASTLLAQVHLWL